MANSAKTTAMETNNPFFVMTISFSFWMKDNCCPSLSVILKPLTLDP
jgi:hypothetical protein